MNKSNILLVIFLISLLQVNKTGAQSFFNGFEPEENSSPIWMNTALTDSVYSYSGKYSAFADSVSPYGAGVTMVFPETVKNKSCYLKIKGFALRDSLVKEALYVITLNKDGKNIFWKGIPLNNSEIEKWFLFEDSIKIPANIAAEAEFITYLWNTKQKGKIYIDNLNISFNKLKHPSFIDDVREQKEFLADSLLVLDTLFNNSFYSLVKNETGTFAVTGVDGDKLFSNVTLFMNTVNKKYVIPVNGYPVIKTKRDKSFLKYNVKTDVLKGNILVEVNKLSPEIKFSVNVKFKKDVSVKRIALLMNYEKPLKEVLKYSRKSDIDNFRDEYWLGNEGVIIGNDSSTVLTYHNTGLSSLQLDNKNKILIFNLDYFNDHHYLKFPLLSDTFDVKKDESLSRYKKGDKKEWRFKLFAGVNAKVIPVFMKNRDGFLATYIWTEHADWTDIKTHRATYFGSENINNADSATGGFVRYKIPVTKSVFYCNPDSVKNTEGSDSLFNTPELSIKENPVFLDFLKQITSYGSEICLHTPDHYTTTYELMDSALTFMRQNFGSKTWIDHGYNNLPQNNREDFVCDGVNNFAGRLWKKYGIKYFWTPYFEDFPIYANWSFDNSIEKVYSGYGDFFPRPDYWQHPTVTGSFIHWPTPNVLYINDESLWGYYFSDFRIKDFISNWSVAVNHCYPAWTLPGKGFWKYGTDSTIVAMDGFNNVLKKMSELKSEGLLNVTTVGDYLDYRLAVDSVGYEFLPDGRVKVINNSSKIIKGLSMNVRASSVKVNDLKPFSKKAGDYIIFWFDLKPGESKIIRWIK